MGLAGGEGGGGGGGGKPADVDWKALSKSRSALVDSTEAAGEGGKLEQGNKILFCGLGNGGDKSAEEK